MTLHTSELLSPRCLAPSSMSPTFIGLVGEYYESFNLFDHRSQTYLVFPPSHRSPQDRGPALGTLKSSWPLPLLKPRIPALLVTTICLFECLWQH